MDTTRRWWGGHLLDIPEDECWELLEATTVGRIAWCEAGGPVVLPVNIAVHDGAIWMRSDRIDDELLAAGARVFADRCAAGIEANRERCESMVEQSLAMCTSLAPLVGYDKAAEIAKESFKTGKTVRQIAMEKNVLDRKTLDKVLDARRMTEPQSDMIGSGGG